MEKFVTYQQAVALKEIGYDKYSWFGMECSLYKADGNHTFYANGIGDETYISAPLKSEVFQWFRKEHNLKGFVEPVEYLDDTPETYMWVVYNECHSGAEQLTYEEAESACIDKLIEIIKTK